MRCDNRTNFKCLLIQNSVSPQNMFVDSFTVEVSWNERKLGTNLVCLMPLSHQLILQCMLLYFILFSIYYTLGHGSVWLRCVHLQTPKFNKKQFVVPLYSRFRQTCHTAVHASCIWIAFCGGVDLAAELKRCSACPIWFNAIYFIISLARFWILCFSFSFSFELLGGCCK